MFTETPSEKKQKTPGGGVHLETILNSLSMNRLLTGRFWTAPAQPADRSLGEGWSAAATALSGGRAAFEQEQDIGHAKAVSRCACHRNP